MKGICPKCGGLLMPGTPSCLVCRKAEMEIGAASPSDLGEAEIGNPEHPMAAKEETVRTDHTSEGTTEPLSAEEKSPEWPRGVRHQHGPQGRSEAPRRGSTIMNDLPRRTKVRCGKCGQDCPAIKRSFVILYECGRCGLDLRLRNYDKNNKIYDGYLFGIYTGYASPDDWDSEQWKKGKSMAIADRKALKETSPPDPYSAFRPREEPVTSASSDGSGETTASGRKSEWAKAMESKDPNAVRDLIHKIMSERRKSGRRNARPSHSDFRRDDISPPVVYTDGRRPRLHGLDSSINFCLM